MFCLNVKLHVVLKSILFCIVFTGLLVVFSFLKAFIPVKYERFAYAAIGTGVAFLTTYLFLCYDKKSFSAIGLNIENSTIIKFIVGILTGIFLMGLMVLAVIYFSNFRIELNNNSNFINFLFWTSPLIFLSLMEEIGFRAYPLVLLKKKLGLRSSILITSILFALYHIANGWTFVGSFLGPGTCGIIFGLAAIYSKGIAMPIGIHYAFNLTSSAFGISNQSLNIWVLKQSNGSSLENYQNSEINKFLPQIALLIVGISCMEYVVRRKVSAHV